MRCMRAMRPRNLLWLTAVHSNLVYNRVYKRERERKGAASIIHQCHIASALPSAASYKKGKGSPYSIAERRVPELIPVLGSQPAGDVSHKPGGRLPLLSTRPAVTVATLKRAATNFAAW